MNDTQEKAAFICVKDTLDGAYPSLVLAINAARQGMESKIFYSFMGMNLVLKGGANRAKFFPPGVMGAIPGISSLATGMMKKKIEKANIPSSRIFRRWPRSKGSSWWPARCRWI